MEPDRVCAVLRYAAEVGMHLVDAADVYSWGVSREFATVRAACCAQIAAVAAGALVLQPAPVPAPRFREAAARGARAAAVERAR